MRIAHFPHALLSIVLSVMIGGNLVAAPYAYRPSITATSQIQNVDTYVRAQTQRMRIPGLALGIVRGDQIVHLQGFGVADSAGHPVSPQTPFILGSISKSFTASAVLRLVEQGRIELDAPVQRYLPWFRVAAPGASSQITVRELLNQTSGLPISAGLQAYAKPDETMEQAVRGLSAVSLAAPVGTKFIYCNANYFTLGVIIEAVTHEAYGRYIQREFFAPLHMRQSFASQSEAMSHGLATGHIWLFGASVPSDQPEEQSLQAAGGLISSAEDMTHYLTMQLNQGRYFSAKELSPTSVNTMHTPAPGSSYGMGWYVGSDGDEPLLFHGGNTVNFSTSMLLAPNDRWGIVVLLNKESPFNIGDPTDIARGVLSILLGKQPTIPVSSDQASLIVDGIVVLSAMFAIWSMVRLLRRRRRLLNGGFRSFLLRLALPLVWELVIPLGILLLLPALIGPWPTLALYVPGVAQWAFAVSIFLLATGALRWSLALRQRSLGHFTAS